PYFSPKEHAEAGLAQVAGGEEAADVRGEAADGDRREAVRLQQRRIAGVLGREGVGLEVAVVALAPDGVEAVAAQSGQEVGAGGAGDTVWRVEVVAAAEEGAVIGRVPVGAGVDPRPRQVEQAV